MPCVAPAAVITPARTSVELFPRALSTRPVTKEQSLKLSVPDDAMSRGARHMRCDGSAFVNAGDPQVSVGTRVVTAIKSPGATFTGGESGTVMSPRVAVNGPRSAFTVNDVLLDDGVRNF